MDTDVKYIRNDSGRATMGSIIAHGFIVIEDMIITKRDIINDIILENADRFLDVGCGLGRDIRNLAMRYPHAEYYGCDRYITDANILGTFIKADAARLPFADKSFDLVIANALMCELSKQDADDAISELRRVGKRVIYTELLSNYETFEVITIC